MMEVTARNRTGTTSSALSGGQHSGAGREGGGVEQAAVPEPMLVGKAQAQAQHVDVGHDRQCGQGQDEPRAWCSGWSCHRQCASDQRVGEGRGHSSPPISGSGS